MTARTDTRTVFQVIANTDTTEGRGSNYTVGWFLTEGVAKSAARGKGPMGTDARVEREQKDVVIVEAGGVRKIFLLGPPVDASYEDPAEVRRRALAKLTPEEREALGVK